jgi:hypothetical protein
VPATATPVHLEPAWAIPKAVPRPEEVHPEPGLPGAVRPEPGLPGAVRPEPGLPGAVLPPPAAVASTTGSTLLAPWPRPCPPALGRSGVGHVRRG